MVVGRLGDDRTWITLPVAVAADPILDVPEATQRVLAAGLLSAHRLCVDAGPELAATKHKASEALDLVPHAVAWAKGLAAPSAITPGTFATRSATTMLRCTIDGVVESGTSDCDSRLRALLEVAIAACPTQTRAHRISTDAELL